MSRKDGSDAMMDAPAEVFDPQQLLDLNIAVIAEEEKSE